MKKTILMTVLVCSISLFGQGTINKTEKNDEAISDFLQLSVKQLFDTAIYYFNRNNYDTALIFYNLLINTHKVKDSDVELQKKIIAVYNNIAVIYNHLADYQTAYEILIKGLTFSEKYNNNSYLSHIYLNMGNIYFNFNGYEIAKMYYSKALDFTTDKSSIVVLLNNLGAVESKIGTIDSAFHYLNKSLEISKEQNSIHLHVALNGLASIYKISEQYDSSYIYFKLALEEVRKNNNIEREAAYLSNLGELFCKTNRLDSASYYLDLSNKIAEKNNFKDVVVANSLRLSNVEELKGNSKKAFEHYKQYVTLKDSIVNATNLGNINQLQRLYEISKTNKQIEEHILDKQVKEKIIHFQKIIQNIIITVLFIMGGVLVIIILQNKKLKMAYNVLVKKNVEIVEFQKKEPEIVSEINPVQNQVQDISETLEKKDVKNSIINNNKALPEQLLKEILNKILIIMENSNIYCDSTFSIEKLSSMINYNHKYISEVIKTTYKKNFRSFINGYRIKEALRLFSEPNLKLFTIEFVSSKVGYRSRTSFINAFKEITGICPSYYLKKMMEGKLLDNR